jgi:hypothetical protein
MSETGPVDNGGPPEATPETGGEQDGQQQGSGFVDLNDLDIPRELHPHMERYIREKVDPHLTRKQQELADLRKPYEAFEGIQGLADVPAEDLTALLDFHGIVQDPERFAQWFTERAEESLEANPEGFEEWWKGIGEKLGYSFDGDDTGEEDEEPGTEGLTREEVERMLAEREQQAQQKADEERQNQETLAQAKERVDKQLGEFLTDLGPDMTDEDKQEALTYVMRLATSYSDEDADEQVPKAIADYKRLVGRGEEQLIDKKLEKEHDPALNGGATLAGERATSMEAAHEAARKRFATGVGRGT